jgi:DNA-directed RNA polymerase subunit RPC12/RpoP
MHRHGRFRHGPGFFRPWGGFWLIILAIIFFRGHWWPGILVLIGLGLVFGSFFRNSVPPQTQNPPSPAAPMPPPVPLTMAAAPIEQIHRSDLLPANCSQCGGPIRSYEVKWTGKQSAACPYCESNLPMKKS